MSERLRVPNRLRQTVTIFYMTPKVANPGVENIAETVLPKEKIAENAHTLSILVLQPKLTQVSNSVNCLLILQHVRKKIVKRHLCVHAHRLHHFLIPLHETYYRLPVVFRDVFCLILQLFIATRLPILLLPTPLVLRHSFLLSYPPSFFIEITVKDKLRNNWVREERNHGVVLVLLFNDLVEHAIVVSKVIVPGKDVIQLHLAYPFALFGLVMVGKHGEVENRRALIGLNHN